MNKRILVINGPNLNMLGIREPEIYGRQDYNALCAFIRENAEKLNLKADIFQSNYEGEIIDRIQKAYRVYDGIIINAGGYTHTSIAILDALRAVGITAVEVHLSDINVREPFRKISYCGMACAEHYIGLGFDGYKKALEYFFAKNEG